jgi:hypothetical protein
VVMLLTCIWEVVGSDLSWNTSCPSWLDHDHFPPNHFWSISHLSYHLML